MQDVNSSLAIAGVFLFLIGLINGVTIPLGKSPRINLSAHLTAVQCGTFLIAVAVLWPHVPFGAGWSGPTALALWVSLYALWLALFIAGLAGAGRDLPIAGGDIRSEKLVQTVSSILLHGSVVVSLLATASLAYWIVQ